MTNDSSDQFLRPDKFWYEIGLRANQTVVHLGCGAGFFLNPAAKIVGSQGKVIGVDIRPDILQEAEGRASRDGFTDIITTIRTDLENGPADDIKSGSSDWTLVVNILSQADPEKIMHEAKRITKPGGRIVVVEWSVSQSTIGPPVNKRTPKDQIIAIANELNLKIAKEFTPSPYHYGLFIEV
jgi:ubiquinone/menaquinone biosynthesis C-methylase UbiE